MGRVWLKKERDRTIRQHHPWVFSGAVGKIEGNPSPGEVVEVVDAKGNFLAQGYFNPSSKICIRLLEWDDKVTIDEKWWKTHLTKAIEHRRALAANPTLNAYRLVYSEADFLPGLIVDRYGDFIVIQALTVGIDRIKQMLAEQLNELLNLLGIFERSDVDVRKLEGLPLTSGVLLGASPSELIEIKEGGHRFLVSLKGGQKTGYYLDQRTNRKIVADYARGRTVLDCFSYTGGFSVYALEAGARSVTLVDSSTPALYLAKKNLELNALASYAESIAGDAFQVLRKFRDTGRTFDLVILDPPNLAPTQVHVKKAMRAYKDINLLAMKLLRPEGILVTFSCSGGVDLNLFKEMVFWASLDSGRKVQILKRLSQGDDHPLRLTFPESEYLKGLICRIL